MKKILFPTDFSPASLNAFAYALHIAKKCFAEILTLHVCNIPVTFVYDYAPVLNYDDDNDWINLEKYKVEAEKLHRIAEANQAADIRLTHILECGDASDTILQVAEREKADYIVMGTKGSSGINELIIGTVAEKIMNSSEAMVLAIPVQCQYPPIAKILFLTRYEKRDEKKLAKVVHFAESVGAHIDALWITSVADIDKEKIIGPWKKLFSNADIDFHILGGRHLEEDISDYIIACHVDMVAMTVKHKGLFEKLFAHSVARHMAFHAQIPVLAIAHA